MQEKTTKAPKIFFRSAAGIYCAKLALIKAPTRVPDAIKIAAFIFTSLDFIK